MRRILNLLIVVIAFGIYAQAQTQPQKKVSKARTLPDGQFTCPDERAGQSCKFFEELWQAGDESIRSQGGRIWLEAISEYNKANWLIEDAEEQKLIATAKLKRMIGTARAANAGGWKAAYKRHKARYEVTVEADSAESLQKVYNVLARLANSRGVLRVKQRTVAETLQFHISEVKP